ncbi:hypothetical protein FACS189429_5390 [Bacteroidia bacterium]|nr:hypothetical protein FACS189429_5390 [Bacteroidia bacterium]
MANQNSNNYNSVNYSYLHYFNPGHEAAVMNGSPFYQSPANVQTMQRELAFLPAWYAQNTDFVLVDADFDFDFFEKLKKNLPSLPQPISFIPHNNPFDSLRAACWGISPAAIHFFEKIKTENVIDLQIPQWKCEFRHLASRTTANECLIYLKNKIPAIQVAVPQFVTSMQEAENLINNANEMLIVKSPFSSSGRGILRINPQDFNRATRQILQGWLNRQGCVSIEPMLCKVLDFALEFRCNDSSTVEFAGYSLFETDEKGSYTGNILNSQENIKKVIIKYIDIQLISNIKIEIRKFLQKKYKNYSGYLGVDMLIYNFENQYFIYPCVEINMRANMGILAVNLVKNFLFSAKSGRFTVNYDKITGNILKHHQEMTKKFPPRFTSGKLLEGYLPLCPVSKNSKYWAYVIVN